MTSALIDTNIFIDIFGPRSTFTDWSVRILSRLRPHCAFVLSPVVLAELAGLAPSEDALMARLDRLQLSREDLPFSAAYQAGVAHLRYRRAGGGRERTLPDFLIGAHALVCDHVLLTRDSARYRSYFPSLSIVSPDSHP